MRQRDPDASAILVSGVLEMTPFYLLAVGILVTWRITHLIVTENGPFNVLNKLRSAAGNGALGELLSCFYCLSLWISAPLAVILASSWKHRVILWPALSAGAILLERLTSSGEPAAPIILEEAENPRVLRS
ncbi:MAG TPA: DUF1360 domain-containing protein [Bryobacteraceae bacterium]|nr:DUF1360 domain-containing protein [Bryobacteraceae bacterium]